MDQNFMALVELKNGLKCEGRIVGIDKNDMKIVMANVTRYSAPSEGEIRKEFFPELSLNKEEILEVKKISYEPAVDPNQTEVITSGRKKIQFDKTNEGFFDNLMPMTHEEAINENTRYNEKNQETFFSGINRRNSRNYYRRGRGNKNEYYSNNYNKGYYGYTENNYNYNRNYYTNRSSYYDNYYGGYQSYY